MDKNIRTCALMLAGISIVSTAYAYHAQEVFLHGNRAYAEKNWKNAFTLYNSIPQKGFGVWYNMGNCCYKLGDIPRAIIYWKRASRSATWSEHRDIERNIDAARTKLGLRELPYTTKVWERFSTLVPILPAQLMLLISWYALWVMWFMVLNFHVLRYVMISILLCIMVIMGIVVSSHCHTRHGEYAIVLQSETKILAGPHEGYQVLDVVACADEVPVYEKRSGWYKVVGHARQGWISADNVELV